MDYAFVIYGEEKIWDEMTDEERDDLFAQHVRFGREIAEARLTIRYGARLARPDIAAKEPRAEDGVQEPGGLWIIDLPGDEEAMYWAERIPLVHGNVVDVRRCDRPGDRPDAEA
ncbi:YciI family protein [Yinghuangia seranimata]|uniref:YciI family protein n=1 Tax=Yinghuangia seranimata TaxID=408067 RepID=UPI00248C9151|nr:YciI family protein [Yinghuangia seranimata]MDI2130078.1 YciI family protein [Yinghuangia seranimata]